MFISVNQAEVRMAVANYVMERLNLKPDTKLKIVQVCLDEVEYEIEILDDIDNVQEKEEG